MIWASNFSQSAHRKGPPNKNPYRAAARACKLKIRKYGGIVRGMVFLKIEYIRRDLPLLCIFYAQSTLATGFVRPNGFSTGVCSQIGFEIFFYATEGMNNSRLQPSKTGVLSRG